MANVILKFSENKKKKGQLIGFSNKKVHFLCNDSPYEVKAGEAWECFIWSEQEQYILVKPFKKIDVEKIKEEELRVENFNKEIKTLEGKMNADFSKVAFDDKNKPYLQSKLTFVKTKEKYPTYIVKKYKDRIYARPIISSEDRVEWRMLQAL